MSDASDLYRAVGALEGTVQSLETKVAELTKQVEMLTAILNQGKGAKWLIVLLPSIIGVLGAMAGYFGVKFTVGH